MNAGTVIKWGVIGVGLYALYKWLAPGPNTGGCFLSKAVGNVAQGISDTIINWTTCSPISLNGNVVLPNGSQVALNNLPVGQDCAGNVYVQYQGSSYQLSPSNSCGNYQATQVS